MKDHVARIRCPQAGESREKRLEALFADIDGWVYSEALTGLVRLFGGEIPNDLGLKEYIGWLNDFVVIWDYRKRQSDGGERWQIDDDARAEQLKGDILEAASDLGLIEPEVPICPPDYILPLGGARLSNLARAEHSLKMAEMFMEQPFSIVALTGKRPIDAIEIEYVSTYASDVKTEYEAMNVALEKTFALQKGEYLETSFITDNCNQQWAIREYAERYRGHKIYSLAAPSSDPSRRANSLDTFNFFMQRFNVRKPQRLLLVTSCIYVPFQLLKFVPISIERDIVVDCVGVPATVRGSQFSKPSNYLQEIKGTVNAIKHIADIYL